MHRSLAGLILICMASTAYPESSKHNTFSAYAENDILSNTDQNYTHGTKFSWISPDLDSFELGPRSEWLRPLVENLPYIHDRGERNITISLGQNLYTPQDITRTDLIEDDRPYGGWLYMGWGFQRRDDKALDSWELNIGIVGPYSWAGDVQKAVHEQLKASPRPLGWHHQIDTEIGLNIAYLNKKRIFESGDYEGWRWEFFRHWGYSLGNIAIYGNLGAETRFGWKLPKDFGNSLIRMGQDTNHPIEPHSGFGAYLFAGTDFRGIARDIFLDGNTFKDSHSVSKNHWVADGTLGFTIIYKQFKLSATQVFRGKQFKLQQDEHTFGSLSFSYTF